MNKFPRAKYEKEAAVLTCFTSMQSYTFLFLLLIGLYVVFRTNSFLFTFFALTFLSVLTFAQICDLCPAGNRKQVFLFQSGLSMSSPTYIFTLYGMHILVCR